MRVSTKGVALCLSALLASGCSFWGGSDEPQPQELVEFAAERTVKELWSRDIGSNLGDKFQQFLPGVTDTAVFVTDIDGTVTGYNQQDGKQLWRTELELVASAGVGVGFGRVIVVSEDGEIVALSETDGSELWRAQLTSEVVSQPQLNRELVVVQLVSGDIVALEASSGEQRWSYDGQMPRLTLRGTSAPLVALDVTLAGLDNGKFIALDNASGDLIWEQRVNIATGRSELERMTDVDAKPLLYRKVVYLAGFKGQLTAIDPFSAQTLWRRDISSFRNLSASNGNVYLTGEDDSVYAFDAESSAEVWRQDNMSLRRVTSPQALEDTVVVGDSLGYLHFMSTTDGRFVARHRIGGSLWDGLISRNDILFVLNNDGELSALTLN